MVQAGGGVLVACRVVTALRFEKPNPGRKGGPDIWRPTIDADIAGEKTCPCSFSVPSRARQTAREAPAVVKLVNDGVAVESM